MRQGDDVAIYATGIMTALALDTAEILAGTGIEAAVLNVPTIKPLDTAAVLDAAGGKRLAVTMEEHWISGGLGSAVAETLAEVRGYAAAAAHRRAGSVWAVGYRRRAAGPLWADAGQDGRCHYGRTGYKRLTASHRYTGSHHPPASPPGIATDGDWPERLWRGGDFFGPICGAFEFAF